MLELIFQGFIEWGYGLILEVWQYFSSVLLDIMGMDFAYLRAHMPIIDTIMQCMLAVGWALLIGNLAFQAMKSMMSGLGFEGEDPKLLFARTFAFGFLLLASPQICELCLNLTSLTIELLEVPDAVNITFADEASFYGMRAAWLLVVICGIIVLFQSFKLIFEMAERYLILAVLTITAPLAFSMGGSRNTSDIFSGWCRMYGSMCLLMVMHVVFIKMLLSVLSFYPSGLDVLPWIVLVISVVKVAKKIDAIITRIGLNPAITGDPLGRTFPGALSYMVVRAASSQVSKTIGKSSGSGRGRTSAPPPGGSGGPRSSGPNGGARVASVTGAAGNSSHSESSSTAHTEQTSRQGSAPQTSDARQDMPRQGAGQIWEGSMYSAEQHATGYAAVDNGRVAHAGTGSLGHARKTSVPPGTRRSPSHIKTAAGMVSGSAPAERSALSGDMQRTGNDAASPARFTQVSSPQAVEGSMSSTVHATEQNNISIGRNNELSRPVQPGKTPSVVAPGSAAGRSGAFGMAGADEISMTRSTARPPGAEAEGRSHSRTTAIPSPAGPGAGGPRSGERASSQGPRSARNPSPPVSPPPTGAAPSSPVRQELRQAPASATAPENRPTSPIIPGTAGTAPVSHRASQARQPVREQAARAKSTPMAVDTHGIKRTSSMASMQEKRTPSRNVAPKPPRRNGGTDNG